MTTILYPLDPSGTLASNKIINEQHILTAVNSRDYYTIVPKLGPFFEMGVIIEYQNQQGAVRPLVKNVDYYFGNVFLGASHACAKSIYGSITLIDNTLSGVLNIKQYQSIGGEWVFDVNGWTAIIASLAGNPRTVTWEQLVGTPITFPVIDHEWNLTDMVGVSEVVAELRALTNALLSPVSQPTFNAHMANMNNPHGNTSTSVGLGNLQNFPIATLVDLKNGAANKYLTPITVKQRLIEYSQELIDTLSTTGMIGDFGALTQAIETVRLKLEAMPTSLDNVIDDLEYTAKDRVVTPMGVWNFLKRKIVSPEAGNQLSFHNDGLYLGVTAPPDVAALYVNAVTGVDTNFGTRASPLKTLYEACMRGPSGISRTIYLAEEQTHYVRPEKMTIMRGGAVTIQPYGPKLDAIPHPYGGANYATAEALALGTTIEATQFVNSGEPVSQGGSGIWQKGAAFIGIDNVAVRPAGLTIIPGKPIPGSPYPVGRDCASFSTYWSGASWTFYCCKLKTTVANQRFFGEAIYAPINILMIVYNILEGPGLLAITNTRSMNISNISGGFTDAQLRAMLDGAVSTNGVYTSFTTNLLP